LVGTWIKSLQKGISPTEELPFVIEMQEELQVVLSRREALPADFEPAQHLFRPGPHEKSDPESHKIQLIRIISPAQCSLEIRISSFPGFTPGGTRNPSV
jgi:hypothetical protein